MSKPLVTISHRGRRGYVVCLVSPNREHILRRQRWPSARAALLDVRRQVARGARVVFPNAVRDLAAEAHAEADARLGRMAAD
jgi:hypothetical protein